MYTLRPRTGPRPLDSSRPSVGRCVAKFHESSKTSPDQPTSSGFENLGLLRRMLAALAKAEYLEPTPIQAGLIPRALAGVDVLGQARTGTGKTAAFVIPILEKLAAGKKGHGPQALVLVPTRELAVQVREEVRQAGARPQDSLGGRLRRQADPRADRKAVARRRGRHRHARPRARPHGPRHAASSTTCGSSCSTRPTGCSTSASGPTSKRSCAAARDRGRRCC